MKKSEVFLSLLLATAVFFLCVYMASIIAPADSKPTSAAKATN